MAKTIGFDENVIKDKFIKYKITCPNCGAISLFDKDELKYNYDQREMCTWHTCTCPNCNMQISTYTNIENLEYFDKDAYETETRINITGYK